MNDLRHTAASRMVAAGTDLPTVASLLGHADIHTTMRYAHPAPENKVRAIQSLDSFCSDKPVLKIAQ